jgi:DNA (cytosine-5)-methyltransferase 1
MIPLTVGSLFSGIGGFELGLERTGGFKTVWQCEIDPFCQKVLAKHWQDVKRFTDIKTMGLDEEIPYVDVICGGFPCQDISCAGKGAGIHAERSGLWWEMLRIICLVRPKYILVENVAALLNRGLDEVLGSLAESGYDAEWQILRACDFGLPHRRERLYLIAHCKSLRWTKMLDGMGKEAKQRRYSQSPKSFWGYEPALCVCAPGYTYPRLARLNREDNGISDRVDRLRALGNAIVPQCAQFMGQCLLDSIGVEA